MRGKWLLVGGTVVVVALGIGALSLLRRQQTAGSAAAARPQATAGSTGPALSLPGRIEAMEVVTVPAPFDGRIESFSANVGEEVVEGQPLAEIRSSDLEAERTNSMSDLARLRARLSTLEGNLAVARLEAAKADESAASARSQVDSALKDLQRQQMLYSKGAASRLSLEKFQAAFDSASAVYERLAKVSSLASGRVAELAKELDAQEQSLNEKNRDVEDATQQVASGDVVSPVDGFIIARRGEVGDPVTVDVQDLFQIAVNLAQLKVVISPPPNLLGKIRPGQAVLIQIAEIADPIESKVTDVHDGQVVIEFTSPNAVIKPGMTVQVVIKLT